MAFWTSVGATTSDPKRGFRWKIEFAGLADDSGVVWFAKKVNKPNFSITESKHSFLNHNFHWPGRVEWQDISLTLVDPVSTDAVQKTNQMIANAGYTIPSKGEYNSMSKGKSQSALGAVTIMQLDADGKAIETWTLKQAWIKTVKFGELSYEDDNLTEIEIGLKYDWAECVVADGTTYYTDQAQ